MFLVRSFIYYVVRILTFFIDIADYIYSHPQLLDIELQGIWIADRQSMMFLKNYAHFMRSVQR